MQFKLLSSRQSFRPFYHNKQDVAQFILRGHCSFFCISKIVPFFLCMCKNVMVRYGLCLRFRVSHFYNFIIFYVLLHCFLFCLLVSILCLWQLFGWGTCSAYNDYFDWYEQSLNDIWKQARAKGIRHVAILKVNNPISSVYAMPFFHIGNCHFRHFYYQLEVHF